MTAAEALAGYTQAMDALKAHLAENKPVFDAHQRLVFSVMDKENALRDAVAATGHEISNAKFRVTVTPQQQTFADIEVLDQYVATGIVPKNVRDNIVKTQQRPPHISIKDTSV